MELRPSDVMVALSCIMTRLYLVQRSTYRRHTRPTNLIAPFSNRMCSHLGAEYFGSRYMTLQTQQRSKGVASYWLGYTCSSLAITASIR